MDGGAWWAEVHGVAKSRTWLSDFTFTFSLSCLGEGNGKPLQCSCLENLRDGGAWWAAVYGVTQNRTRLKWLSSSSSIPRWSSGFPYFLQFQSEFGNKEFMICATVSSRSCFCWLYRGCPSLAAKNKISLILVLTIWWWQTENHNHRKLTNLITWTTAVSNSVKQWALPCRATGDGWVMVEISEKIWSTGQGNGKPLQYSCLDIPMNNMQRQTDRTLKDEFLWLVCAQYATGDEWRNNFRKNKEMEPKEKQHPVVDVTGDGSKVRCCKEQYCIGSWNVRPMNQGKLEVVEQEMARANIDILGISELKWTGMGEFN